MWDNLSAFIKAIVIHIILFTIIIMSLDWPFKPHMLPAANTVMQAVAVDDGTMLKTLQQQSPPHLEFQKQIKQNEQSIAQEQQRLETLRQQEQQKQIELKKREEEQQRKQAEQQRKQAEQQRQQEAAEKKRQQAEKKRQEQERQRRLEAQEAQRLAEKKRQEEARRQTEEAKARQRAEAKRQAEAEARRRAEAEAKRQAEAEARRRAEAEAKRRAEAEARRQAAAQENKRRVQTVMTQIKQKVEGHWIRPPGVHGNLTCVIQIRLIPDGSVGAANVIQSSGNPAFDNSAIAAIYKASPLPVPRDIFDEFRRFNFRFSK